MTNGNAALQYIDLSSIPFIKEGKKVEGVVLKAVKNGVLLECSS